MIDKKLRKALLAVQKPGRYTGGEMNADVKPIAQADISFAFCFPDTYEVAMSHLGMKILYGILNSLLKALGILDTGISWLGQPGTALLCVIIARTWQMLPWYMAFLLGG